MLELKSPFIPPEIIPSTKQQKQELEQPKWNSSKHEIGVGPENTSYGTFKISDKSPLQKLVLDSTVNRNESLNLKSGVENYHGKSLSLSVNYRGGKQLIPIRRQMNNTVLDAQHLGFKLPEDFPQAFSPSSALSQIQGKVSPRKKELRKK
jgi:hypothetical protein